MYQEYKPSRFQILPPVVKNLLIINGLLFLASKVLGERFGIDLGDALGLHYPSSEKFAFYQLLTHLFMHGSFLHLFSNMFALWMFGNMLENLWGSRRFLTFYLITGVGAAVVHLGFTAYEISRMENAIHIYASNINAVDFRMLVEHYKDYIDNGQFDILNRVYAELQQHPTDALVKQESIDAANMLLKNKIDIPTVGASGAVFGVLLAFGMLFPNTILYIYFALPIKAKYFVAMYGLFELYSGFENTPGDNVAHFAHLGGMLFGFILIKIWNKYNRNRFY
jgi:membrane associated rhomboid family serine protease